MIINLIKTNRTLRELIYGILIFGVVALVPVLIFTDKRLYYSTGLLAGIFMSVVCAIHMAWGIEIAVNLDEKSSIAVTRKYTVIRYLLLCVVLGVIGVSDVGSPVTLIIGFLGLKMGAYLNPFIHRITTKNNGGDGEQ